MPKWSFSFMSMSSILLFFYESSISKRINMTPVFEINAANNAKTAPDIKSSVQNIKVQFIKSGRILDSSVNVGKR